MGWLKRSFLFALTLVLLAVPFVVFFKAQALVDWWQLRNYMAPPAVAALAQQDTMTAYATHVFYVNHPDLETDTNQFRTDCNESEKTIVLGCYHGNQDGIFLYNVNDSRLAGVQQVTAAHEMLHAAYDRLSSKDRNNVDSLLENYYHMVTDQRLIDTINAYKQSEPNDMVNEMHSIFGTEIANLPAPLEAYYTRYFSNRHAITDYAANYENEFDSRQNEIKADDAQLAQLKASIDQQEQTLNSQLNQVNSDRARLNAERSSGNIAQYNSDVPGFNNEISGYNAGVDRLRADIAAYNQLVGQRNAIAAELASLSKAIDTRLTPQAAQ
jgi:hypothetical protein